MHNCKYLPLDVFRSAVLIRLNHFEIIHTGSRHCHVIILFPVCETKTTYKLNRVLTSLVTNERGQHTVILVVGCLYFIIIT